MSVFPVFAASFFSVSGLHPREYSSTHSATQCISTRSLTSGLSKNIVIMVGGTLHRPTFWSFSSISFASGVPSRTSLAGSELKFRLIPFSDRTTAPLAHVSFQIVVYVKRICAGEDRKECALSDLPKVHQLAMKIRTNTRTRLHEYRNRHEYVLACKSVHVHLNRRLKRSMLKVVVNSPFRNCHAQGQRLISSLRCDRITAAVKAGNTSWRGSKC